MTSKPFTTCLWFDTQDEAAAHYYMGIFKDSRLGRVRRYTSAGPGPEGTVATVEFELNGQRRAADAGARARLPVGQATGLTRRSPTS